VKRRLVRSLYGTDIDDARGFTIVADASRISGNDLVSTVLCAARSCPRQVAALSPRAPADSPLVAFLAPVFEENRP
jgi:hypothetical protein